MLDVMEKYGPMEKLEQLRLRNLSMGSLLIILPFAPNLRTLSLRYNAARGGTAAANDESAAPNLTDDLFVKIFQRNQGSLIMGFRGLLQIDKGLHPVLDFLDNNDKHPNFLMTEKSTIKLQKSINIVTVPRLRTSNGVVQDPFHRHSSVVHP